MATSVTKQEPWPRPLLAQQWQGLPPSQGRKQTAGQKVEARVITEQGQPTAGLKLSNNWIGLKIHKEKVEIEALSHQVLTFILFSLFLLKTSLKKPELQKPYNTSFA